jgi:hypothetical protein
MAQRQGQGDRTSSSMNAVNDQGHLGPQLLGDGSPCGDDAQSPWPTSMIWRLRRFRRCEGAL